MDQPAEISRIDGRLTIGLYTNNGTDEPLLIPLDEFLDAISRAVSRLDEQQATGKD